MYHKVIMGCVADDFTGASDLASFLQEAGARCLLIKGLPDAAYHIPNGHDVIVIALKTRSVPAKEAVRQSLAAFDWLVHQGVSMLYFKYCSTFDSTPAGNIGPVLDALMEHYQLPYTILCPSLPVNGRRVSDGILYVKDVPLAESPMKNHPVNPMWDSFIPTLMQAQSKYFSYVLPRAFMRQGDQAVQNFLADKQAKGKPFYLVPDYENEDDAKIIAGLFSKLFLASGGSALPSHLYMQIKGFAIDTVEEARRCNLKKDRRGLIISGSCSKATSEQRKYYLEQGYPAILMRAESLRDGTQTVEGIWQEIRETLQENILVYSCEEHAEQHTMNQKEISAILEKAMAELGRLAIEAGITKLVVAGGETSGAVLQNIGLSAFSIGPSIAPGVPILYPQEREGIQIALKSGNFGEADFMVKALQMMRGDD